MLAIAAGGAVGALTRYGVFRGVQLWLGTGFPYGTLLINISGSFFMGLLYVWLIERNMLNAEWRAALLVGLLGSFTTFSAFSIETLRLLESGEPVKATANVLLSIMLCLLGCWLGLILARQL
ncbi:MAG: fluoride efflux transporter CrcB [Gammaproteobacteria bacterium]